jgi:YD repeat-containing protein
MAGGPTAITPTSAGHAISEISRTFAVGPESASPSTAITYPGGSDEVVYGYVAANRLTSVTDWNLATTGYAYDDAGRMTTATLPASTGVVSSYSYDNADRLLGISHVKGGSQTLAFVNYTLDAVGNRTQRVDGQGTHSYSYDDLYRLTSVTYPGPTTTSYAFGNRTSMTDGSGTTSYTYDDADRLTQVAPPLPAAPVPYTWDNNGNLTNRGGDTFDCDHEDRIPGALQIVQSSSVLSRAFRAMRRAIQERQRRWPDVDRRLPDNESSQGPVWKDADREPRNGIAFRAQVHQ